ncbi:integrase [Asticcacaulis solisilvae]|nr:integrase [Asticcacaulis solisilvae]
MKISLRTGDFQYAKRLCRCLSNAFEVLSARIGQMKFLTVPEVHGFVRTYFQHSLNQALELSHDLPLDPQIDLENEIESLKTAEAATRKRLVSRAYDSGDRGDVNRLLEAFKPSDTEIGLDVRDIAYDGVVRAKLAQIRYLIASLSGDPAGMVVSDPLFVNMLPTGFNEPYSQPWEVSNTKEEGEVEATSKRLDFVIEQFLEFKAKSGVVEKTLADFRRVLGWVADIVGPERPLTSLTKVDVKAFRDALEKVPNGMVKLKQFKGMSLSEVLATNNDAMPISPATQQKYLNFFNIFLNWCHAEELLSAKLGGNLKVIVSSAENVSNDVNPYNKGQLHQIFTSPVFQGSFSTSRRNRPGKIILKDAYYWIPIIALLTGMRLGEIVQLLVADVREKLSILYFDINTSEDKDKRLKTDESKRQVPVPDVLMKLGFQAYLEEAKKSKRKRLFEEIQCAKDGYYSANFSKFWTRYTQITGAYHSSTRFHSFRHCFKDAMEAAETPETINRAIMGHSDKSVHGSYGSGPSLSQKKNAIDKAIFEIDLVTILTSTGTSTDVANDANDDELGS